MMLKLDTLRAAITAAAPELATDPTRLVIWIEKGRPRSTQTDSRSLSLACPVSLLLLETTTPLPVIAQALFEWARVHQPDLLAVNQDAISFDADILDNASADLLFQFEITQAVAVTRAEGGGWSLAYLPEPDPLFVDRQNWLPEPEPSFLETDGPPPVFYTHDETAPTVDDI